VRCLALPATKTDFGNEAKHTCIAKEIVGIENDKGRPCLHCMMVELIDDFFAENPPVKDSEKVDTIEGDEVIDAIAKTVAELTSQQDGVIRQAKPPQA
jgi:hypothetical protein